MPPPVLTTQAELLDLVGRIAGADEVAFDTEFHSERTYVPRLMLLQVATRHGVHLVDPLGVDLLPLVRALTRPGLVVVGHALKNDLRILSMLYGLTPHDVFDTQVAAAFLGHGLQIGLGGLLQATLGVHQPKGDQMSDWSQRPLPDRLLDYAAGDVAHLLIVYDQLREELTRRARLDWVLQECRELCDPARYTRDPDTAWQKVAGGRRMDPKEAGVLHSLAAEREIIASEEDVVPHFLMPDEVLLLLARLAPRNRRDLEADRRFNHRAVQRYAQRWLEAIGRGQLKPMQRAPGRPPPGPDLEAVASLLMLLVHDIALRNNLAPQLLVKRDHLLHALREPAADEHAFAEAAGLHGWRAELLALPLWRMLTRRLCVTCERVGTQGVRMHFEAVETEPAQ